MDEENWDTTRDMASPRKDLIFNKKILEERLTKKRTRKINLP